MGYRVGVDVGGTFTDLLVTDEVGKTQIIKTSTTPNDLSIGFFRALEKAAYANSKGLPEFLKQIDTIVHGTTITTNATLTGGGAITGFITTAGFRDILNMRRGLKERQFEKYAPPPPLVPRHRIRTVKERIDLNGEILIPLNEADVIQAAEYFKEQNVEAVAVSLLWSFNNPVHEERIRELLQEALPDIYISLSVEILPQIRVYERHSTTALNAYVGPILTSYIERLQAELSTREFSGDLLIMQSNGGVMSPDVAQRFASNTLLSGPAGAPMAGIFYGQTHKFKNLITVDMGGTSFDVALIKDANPAVTTEGEVGEYRIASPILDIHTVGAGGGSIAWVNDGGILTVGPKSAGAQPGPACYGRGGLEPTVTDAQYLLGYLDPKFFETGELDFDIDASRSVIDKNISSKLGMDTVTAANGIFEVVNSNMAAALGVVSVQRGYDPREFVLVVAGGAGPIHAAPIARELEIPLILIPRESSVFCAAGMLISDLKHDYVRTYAKEIPQVEFEEVNQLFGQMELKALETLRTEGCKDNAIEITYSIDLRYVGQFNEVEVELSEKSELSNIALEKICQSFHEKHDMLYGYSMDGADVEFINLRVTGVGRVSKPHREIYSFHQQSSDHALLGSRKAFFEGEFMETPIYDGLLLQCGNSISGPAIIVQPTTTIVVPPDFFLLTDKSNNYLMYSRGENIEELCDSLTDKESS